MTDPRKDARREVVTKYARKTNAGKVVFCTPTREEMRTGRPTSKGKPIYDNVMTARDAAFGLRLLGEVQQEPYRCHRSRSGHFHLRLAQGENLNPR